MKSSNNFLSSNNYYFINKKLINYLGIEISLLFSELIEQEEKNEENYIEKHYIFNDLDLVIEGVHIIPKSSWLRDWREAGGRAIGIVATADAENQHGSRSWRRFRPFRPAEGSRRNPGLCPFGDRQGLTPRQTRGFSGRAEQFARPGT